MYRKALQLARQKFRFTNLCPPVILGERRIKMSIEKVRQYLRTYGLDGQIQEFDSSSATVELAAQALNVEPGRIAKTLSFKSATGAIIVVTAGDTKIDNAKYKAQFGLKAKMLTAEEALAFTGHAVGGVCPFGIDEPGAEVFLDQSLKRFATVFPACGSANSAIELTPEKLAEIIPLKSWVDVSKPA